MNKSIKDFLYLDLERVKSLSAQMFGGLLESTIMEKGNGKNAETEISGSIPALASALGRAQLSFTNSVSETKSAHHLLYTNFENELINLGKVGKDVDESTPFIKITGQLQVINYAEIMERVEKVKVVLDYFRKTEPQNIPLGLDHKQRAKIKQEMERKYTFPDQFKDVAKLVKTVFGDTVRFSIVSQGKVVIKSNLQKDFIQFKSAGLVTGSESLSEEEWTFLLRINRKLPFNAEEQDNNPFEKSFSALLKSFRDVINQIDGASEYSVVPIAIYKDL